MILESCSSCLSCQKIRRSPNTVTCAKQLCDSLWGGAESARWPVRDLCPFEHFGCRRTACRGALELVRIGGRLVRLLIRRR